jgi:alkylhydroperoxidase/carboxymuconolactone decarboxylase family protein YurZ
MNDEYFSQGIALMRAALGDAAADAALARHEAAVANGTADRADYSMSVAWGFMMHRPQLSLRDRALIMFVNDVVQLRPSALRDHVRLALYAGMTRDQIEETLFQLSQYCGFPTTREAGNIVRDLFAELDRALPTDR